MIDQEIKIFLDELKEQLYLPKISYHYVATIYDVIQEKSPANDAKEIKVILYLVLLNQLSFSFGDVCIHINDQNNKNAKIISQLVDTIYEELVQNNTKYVKNFVTSQYEQELGENEEEIQQEIKQRFDHFWQFIRQFDQENDRAGYLSIIKKFDLIFSCIYKDNENLGLSNTPLICYPYDDQDPCIYFGKNYAFELMVASLIKSKINQAEMGNSSHYAQGMIYECWKKLSDNGDCQLGFEELIAELLNLTFNSQKETEINVDQIIKDFDQSGEFLLPNSRTIQDPSLDQKKKDPRLVDWQKVAAATACLTNFTVITGGPGTGKTTTVTKLLLLIFALAYGTKFDICLAAPTGKAANRMKESIENSLNSDQIKNIKSNLAQKMIDLRITQDPINKVEDYLNEIPRKSSTIHKLLGLNPTKELPRYNENNQLPYDLIIIDEVSMIDLKLLARLLLALKPTAKLILLGDHEQLPSVEAGAILTDLCQAFKVDPNKSSEHIELVRNLIKITGYEALRLFPYDLSAVVAKLYKSYRFEAAKAIGEFAHDLNVNNLKDDLSYYTKLLNDRDQKQSVKIIPHSSVELDPNKKEKSVEEVILRNIVEQAFPNKISATLETNVEKFSFANYFADLREIIGYPINQRETNRIINLADPEQHKRASDLFKNFNQFRILCANRGTALGVEKINEAMEQRVLSWYGKNSKLHFLKNNTSTWGEHWYPGRPIMINKNNYHLDLFNGDVGITLFYPNEAHEFELRVLFQMSDGSFRYFSTAELSNYELAYAMTVHKSQGSEFDHTVMVLPNYQSNFITRELLYTGITRAKSFVTIYGDHDAIKQYASQINNRSSNLVYRLNN